MTIADRDLKNPNYLASYRAHHPILCFFLTHTSSSPSPPPFPSLTSTSHVFNLYAPRSPIPENRSKLHECFGHVIPALSTMPKSSMSNGVPLDSGKDECGHC